MSIDGKSQHIVSLLWRGVLFLMRCYAVNQHAWRDLRGPLVSSQILKLPAFYYHLCSLETIYFTSGISQRLLYKVVPGSV